MTVLLNVPGETRSNNDAIMACGSEYSDNTVKTPSKKMFQDCFSSYEK